MWHTKNSEKVHQNNWFSVTKNEIIRHNGTKCEYYVVNSRPSVFIVPRTETGFYLIKQYRYAANNISWEFPAGGLDTEQPLTGAKRELEEETGLVAQHWRELGHIFLAPGLTNNKCFVYEATGLTQKEFVCQEDEAIIECRHFSLAEIKNLITIGEMTDGPSLGILAKVMLHESCNQSF